MTQNAKSEWFVWALPLPLEKPSPDLDCCRRRIVAFVLRGVAYSQEISVHGPPDAA